MGERELSGLDPIAQARVNRAPPDQREFVAKTEFARAEDDRLQRAVAALRASIWAEDSPEAKAAMLPPLLELRRRQHLIPNGAFDIFPAYDRVLIWQLGEHDAEEAEKFKGTGIYKPAAKVDYDRAMNPRGLVVGAGLLALNMLRSNGIDLGHTVRFQGYTISEHEVDVVEGKSLTVKSIIAGHVVGSEDLEKMRRAGEARIAWNEGTPDKGGYYEWVNADGDPLYGGGPQKPERGVA